MSNLSLDEPGRHMLFMGNEAMARGAIEAGVRVCAAYPGNPSTEIVTSLAKVGKELGIYVEWSVNEKVALEVAAGASLSGLRSLASMKHNGLNVACDFLLGLNLTGCRGGMVVIVCDDPASLSSSNEQDTRHFAKMADLPLLEPSSYQMGKEMVKDAFELSEQVGLPVLIHSVTRFSHARGKVTLGEIHRGTPQPYYDIDNPLYPKPVEITHKRLHERLKMAGEGFDALGYNQYTGPDQAELVVVTCGADVNYVREAVVNLDVADRVGIISLGNTWPLPQEFLKEHLLKSQQVMFLEEIDPFVEDNVKAFCAQQGGQLANLTFLGKATGTVPSMGENTPDVAIECLAKVLGIDYHPPRPAEYAQQAGGIVAESTTERLLGLCAGCPHRATYWAVKNALALDGRGGFVAGDIGCYAQGRGPSGFNQMKTMFAMGSGAGLANGFGQLNRFGANQPVLAVCGDSTFYHSAIPALINARFNKSNLLMLVLDNRATAMTGFQPHPGVGRNAMGEAAPVVDVADICKALGAEVIILDPFDLDKTIATVYDLLQEPDGIKILVLKQECALVRSRRDGLLYKVKIDPDKCQGKECGCNNYCTRVFKCPALSRDSESGKAFIDEAICNGCGVCYSICPESAITREVA